MRLSRIIRSPFMFWLAVAGLALATALVVAGAIGRAQALARRYGPLRPVVVAAKPVDRGIPLAASDLAVRRLPATFVPEGALGAVDELEGRAPVVPLLAGQAVLRGHLAPDGLVGASALLPPGTRAVAVPAGAASPSLRVGDFVDVLATFEGEPALAVALDAPVVEAGEDAASIAVSPEEARTVAFAVTHGSVTLALTPGGSPPQGQRNLVASTPSTAAPAARR